MDNTVVICIICELKIKALCKKKKKKEVDKGERSEVKPF